jgi:predicted lipoprotein with Yx(FWY)xxD motif
VRSRSLLAPALALVLLAAACGSSTTAAPPSTPSSSNAAGPATIAVATNAKLGQILVDGSGRTVYLFVADQGSTSVCYTDCAAAWPPVLTKGAPMAGAGATASLLGTTTRKDGTTEVMYNGHPLYYFIADKNPGDATGQKLNNFGGPWYVVSPAGAQITT